MGCGEKYHSALALHRSKKEMQQLSLFEKFITEGNETADGVAQEGAMMDG